MDGIHLDRTSALFLFLFERRELRDEPDSGWSDNPKMKKMVDLKHFIQTLPTSKNFPNFNGEPWAMEQRTSKPLVTVDWEFAPHE
jgi:hypothetical protein